MDLAEFLRSILGKKATEKVSMASGVITTVCFDLYGCVQALLKPPVDGDGKQVESQWFDVKRLVISKDEPVMSCPDFIVGPLDEMPDHGPENKPMP